MKEDKLDSVEEGGGGGGRGSGRGRRRPGGSEARGAGVAPQGGRAPRLCAALRHCGSALIRGEEAGGEGEAEEEEKLLWLLRTAQ